MHIAHLTLEDAFRLVCERARVMQDWWRKTRAQCRVWDLAKVCVEEICTQLRRLSVNFNCPVKSSSPALPCTLMILWRKSSNKKSRRSGGG